MTIGQKLNWYLKEGRLSLREVAEFTGINVIRLSRIEIENLEPTCDEKDLLMHSLQFKTSSDWVTAGKASGFVPVITVCGKRFQGGGDAFFLEGRAEEFAYRWICKIYAGEKTIEHFLKDCTRLED